MPSQLVQRLDRGSRLGAVAAAVLAHRDGVIGHLDGRAVGGLHERDLGADGDVAALDRGPEPARPAAAEHPAAERAAAEAAAAEERLEDVGHRAEPLEVGGVATLAQALVAVAVIGGAPVGVREHLVGLGGLLEALLGVGL